MILTDYLIWLGMAYLVIGIVEKATNIKRMLSYKPREYNKPYSNYNGRNLSIQEGTTKTNIKDYNGEMLRGAPPQPIYPRKGGK